MADELEPLFDAKEAEIIRLFEEGGTYRSVAATLGIHPENIRQMIRDPKRALFYAHYVRAREEQANAYADEIVDITKEAGIDPATARMRIDALKWIAGKRKPKVYGDKLTNEHTGADGAALVFSTIYEDTRPKAITMQPAISKTDDD
jgi:hypothetical protein